MFNRFSLFVYFDIINCCIICQSMAFVFGKTSKKSVFQSRQTVPGPGQYNEPSRYLNQHAAPFNSSSFKQTQFDIVPTNAGPGTYNPPDSKSLYSNKRLKMTSSFNSKVQRFKTQNIDKGQHQSVNMKVAFTDNDEPRKYRSTQKQTFHEVAERTKSRMSAIQDANNQRKINSIGVNKQFVRIILSNPHNTEMNQSVMIDSSIIKKQNGPGSYNIDNATAALHNKSMHVVDWSKDTRRRFKTEKNKNPGPGQYQLQAHHKKSFPSSTAAFAYQGLRSHMDQIIYKTKMPFKVKVIEERHLKDRYPGPGQYQPKLTASKSFHYGEEAFGSVETEEHHMKKPSVPGPGYYQINKNSNTNMIKQDIKKARQKIFGKSKIKMDKVSTLQQNHKEQIRKKCIRDMQNEGKYYSLQERCTSKIGNFAQSQRFKAKIKAEKVLAPGPGQYKVQNKKEQSFQKGIQYAFNSTSDRLQFMENAEKIPFYDLDRNDMGKKALRIKKNIQNLKQIDIQKAPFNSKQRRFLSETDRSKNQQDLDINWNPIQNEVKQEKLHKSSHKQYEEQYKKLKVGKPEQSVFKSKTKRNWLSTTNDLGPGNYNYTTTFQKKSFNQEYNYKPPLKIRSTYKTRSSLA